MPFYDLGVHFSKKRVILYLLPRIEISKKVGMMNTKAFEQCDVMDEVELSAVEGGGWKCVAGVGGAFTC